MVGMACTAMPITLPTRYKFLIVTVLANHCISVVKLISCFDIEVRAPSAYANNIVQWDLRRQNILFHFEMENRLKNP